MDEGTFRKIAEEISSKHLEDLRGERTYKIQDAEVARAHVEEALAGRRPWTKVFTGKARSLLNNQLTSNRWVSPAFSALMATDEELLGSMVRRWWQDGDLDGAAAILDTIVEDPDRSEELKTFRGLGNRAAVLSFFRLLKDPTSYPIYRPRHVQDALNALGLRRVSGDTAAHVLRSYDAILDEARELFAAHGLELRDRLDVQGAFWLAKWIAKRRSEESRDGGGEMKTADTRAAPSPGPGEHATSQEVAACLPALMRWLRQRSLHYPDYLVAHFLAALLTKPFVVLSGLSGTGKTRLALEVGRCLGAVEVVPVKPDWTDTRGVLGYLNPLTGQYESTAALDTILDAADTDGLIMLVLDEMNLAHVERYFADVLSAMESGEVIPLHDSVEAESRGIPRRLEWPRNLLLVGTVNADETTYPFSPKVLDRAFVIDMSRADLRAYLDSEAEEAHEGTPPELPAFFPTRAWRRLPVDEADRDFVLELHAALEGAGRPFGYRMAEEALAFLTHAGAFEPFGPDGRDTLLVSKVLPRLHGRRHEVEPALAALVDLIGVDLNDWEDDAAGTSFPRTRALLRTMHRQLIADGHLASLVG